MGIGVVALLVAGLGYATRHTQMVSVSVPVTSQDLGARIDRGFSVQPGRGGEDVDPGLYVTPERDGAVMDSGFGVTPEPYGE